MQPICHADNFSDENELFAKFRQKSLRATNNNGAIVLYLTKEFDPVQWTISWYAREKIV